MRGRRTSRGALVATALVPLLSGCLLGPNYQRPPLETPAHWRDGDPVAADDLVADTASLANTSWWELFQDPALQDVIRQGPPGLRPGGPVPAR